MYDQGARNPQFKFINMFNSLTLPLQQLIVFQKAVAILPPEAK